MEAPEGTPICSADEHDWFYDPGEEDVGLYACWVCRICGEMDVDREAPSEDQSWS